MRPPARQQWEARREALIQASGQLDYRCDYDQATRRHCAVAAALGALLPPTDAMFGMLADVVAETRQALDLDQEDSRRAA